MSTRYAVLGALLQKPGYPYELASRLERQLGPSWEAGKGPVYQAIKALEEAGHVQRLEAGAGDRVERHVYVVTDEGRQEFDRWFDQPPDWGRLPRRPLLIKITLAGRDRLDDALEQVDVYERHYSGLLSELVGKREQASISDPPPIAAEQVLLRINLAADIVQVEAELAWASEARELLMWLMHSHARWPSGAGSSGNVRAARRELMGAMSAQHLPQTHTQKERS